MGDAFERARQPGLGDGAQQVASSKQARFGGCGTG